MRRIDRWINGRGDSDMKWRRWAEKVGGGVVCQPTVESKPPSPHALGMKNCITALDAGKHVGIYYICIAGYANLRPSLPWKVSDVKPSRRKWGALGLLWSPLPLSRLLATRARKCLALNKNSGKVSNWTKVQCVFFFFCTREWMTGMKKKEIT